MFAKSKFIQIIDKNKELIFVALILIFALFLRLYYLNLPDWQIFDEIYYYNFGKDYLAGNYFFDVHPPLGKLFISAGLWLFNDSLFGARFFQAIAGVCLICFIYKLAKIIFKNKTIAIFSIILAFFETSLFVESRYALINIFLVLFMCISATCFWQWRETGKANYFYFTLFFISLAICVKWTGIMNLGAYIIFLFFDKKSRILLLNFIKNKPIINCLKIILILIIPYLLLYLPDYIKGDRFIWWHEQAYGFHKNLISHHPYASRWYTWFFNIRPIWLEFRQTPGGKVFGILEVGNLVIIWGATIALIYNLIYCFIKKNLGLLFILLIILINILPWIAIRRESFYYHFIPVLPYLIVGLGFFLYQIWSQKILRFLVIIYFTFTIAFFIWYWPLLVGREIPFAGYNQRVIFNTWR